MGLTLDDLKNREPKIDFEHMGWDELLKYRFMSLSDEDLKAAAKRGQELMDQRKEQKEKDNS
ncbi:hypothetical protein [Levilactobacillus yiduensis]|uniref:hypothetical protein n=1 Tax=Levilactobacillus yiduensis TaxID=2953880 RepID=UPI000EF2FCE3|nr:hypothetical protein [Levilactobacillus yiduensis]AYM03684.1 hypothetical protein D8911_12075 [Levilactobacillus brevis]